MSGRYLLVKSSDGDDERATTLMKSGADVALQMGKYFLSLTFMARSASMHRSTV